MDTTQAISVRELRWLGLMVFADFTDAHRLYFKPRNPHADDFRDLEAVNLYRGDYWVAEYHVRPTSQKWSLGAVHYLNPGYTQSHLGYYWGLAQDAISDYKLGNPFWDRWRLVLAGLRADLEHLQRHLPDQYKAQPLLVAAA